MQPTIVRSPTRPSSYDRSPTQFGFKKDLSPTLIESLRLVSPRPSRSPSPIPTPTLSPDDSVASPPSHSPSPAVSTPAVPFAWDAWMYAPLELNEPDELEFGAPPTDFGFFHPWNFDAPPTT